MKNVAILGASSNRNKFGNKCVRAYLGQGYNVFPVNPKEREIEGVKCYASLKEITRNIDFISLYLKPEITKKIINEIIETKPEFIYFNPGTEDSEIEQKLKENEIEVRKQCSIVAIGMRPSELE